MQISSLDRNKFSIAFSNIEDRDRIVNASPWAVKGHIIVFQQWSPSATLSELVFTKSPFWVQIHNLPLNRVNLENAKVIGNLLGSFISYDDVANKQKFKVYMRIRVAIDVTKPIKTGIFLKMEAQSVLRLNMNASRTFATSVAA